MAVVFISYRRDDTGAYAGRLHDHFANRWGAGKVFMDIDSIPVGVDFVQHIQAVMSKRPVVIVLIGRNWATVKGDQGGLRLMDPEDPVRMEVAAALFKGLKVIPVLVGGAKMPAADNLPGDIAALVKLNAREISDGHFRYDLQRLIQDIDGRKFKPMIPVLASIVLFALLMAGGWLWFKNKGNQSDPNPTNGLDSATVPAPVVPGVTIEPRTTPIKSDLVSWILRSNPILSPGEIVEVKIATHSSKVRVFGIFPEAAGAKRRVEGTYSKPDGGIKISYPTPRNVAAGRYTAEIYVQQIGSSKEEIHRIDYEIVTASALVGGMSFVEIPGGSFMMGSAGKYKDEKPVHKVNINPFMLMDHEMTVGELKLLLKLSPGAMPGGGGADSEGNDRILVERLSDSSNLPVELTWDEAVAVAGKLGKLVKRTLRLPTEAEWEFAARGGLKGKEYPWGNSGDTVGGKSMDSILAQIKGGSCPYDNLLPVQDVRTLSPKNGYGLYDVAGNVWEWTSSIYRQYPYRAKDGREGPAQEGDQRVIRGGGRAIESCDVRVSFRGYGLSQSTYGVRYVMDR